MKNIQISVIILLLITVNTIGLHGQSPFYSESLIKYDLKKQNHTTDKPIPFDRAFTLSIDQLSSKNIQRIDAYEVKFKNGKRIFKLNTFKDSNKKETSAPVRDVVLRHNPYSDSLQIFFPPLKPNTNFDVIIAYNLSDDCKKILYETNIHLLKKNNSEAKIKFLLFFDCTIDKLLNRSNVALGLSVEDMFVNYSKFFEEKLRKGYTEISNINNFHKTPNLTVNEVEAITISSSKHISQFKGAPYLYEVIKGNQMNELMTGNLDVKNIFNNKKLSSLTNLKDRIKNIKSSQLLIDSIMVRMNILLANGIKKIQIDGNQIELDPIREKIKSIRENLNKNYEYLTERDIIIDAEINKDERLKQGTSLMGNTVLSDLKSAGGSILFVDAGFANIVVPDVNNHLTYLPKLYWGISIYFRPVDKNTRRSRFTRRFDPAQNEGVNTDGTYGPDYGIVTRASIWQHLSLNIGLTLGAIKKRDFDNFYNSNSLLVGPAYRFARAFKISGGLALLNRSSKNPLISEKTVVPGGYISLSADIDFIQGLKDVTNLLFK